MSMLRKFCLTMCLGAFLVRPLRTSKHERVCYPTSLQLFPVLDKKYQSVFMDLFLWGYLILNVNGT